MSNVLATTSVGQIKYLAEWCGLEVKVPVGMLLTKPLQLSNDQLSELLTAVDKHQRIELLEKRLAAAEAQVKKLEEDNGLIGRANASLRNIIDQLNLNNDILRCRAMPEMDGHTANAFMRAIDRVFALMRLRARLTFRKETDLSPLIEKLKSAVINSLTN